MRSRTSTQDNQKVFNSAFQGIKPISGMVKPPSFGEGGSGVYDSLMKLMDVFTGGTLKKQGSNSEYVLRTTYRSLGKEVSELLQNEQAVDKIVEQIKKNASQKQNENKEEEKQQPQKSEPAIVSVDADTQPLQLVLQFLDELQQDILIVKMQLARQVDAGKFKQIESKEKVSEEIDDKKVSEVRTIQDVLNSESKTNSEWKDTSIQETQELLDKFEVFVSNEPQLELSDLEKRVSRLSSTTKTSSTSRTESTTIQRTTYNPEHLISNINSTSNELKPEDIDKQVDTISKTMKDDAVLKKQKPNKVQSYVKPQKNIVQNSPKKKEQKEQKEQKNNTRLNDLTKDQISKITKMIQKDAESAQNSVAGKKNNAKSLFGDKFIEPIASKSKGLISKLKPKPSPIPQPMPQQDSGSSSKNDISSRKMNQYLGIISMNVAKMVKDEKFRQQFTINLPGIQKRVQKEMSKSDKHESKISEYLSRTKAGIKTLWKRIRTGSGNILLKLLGGVKIAAIAIVGGLILITLARMAARKWAERYMPKSNGQGFQIFGVTIPGIEEIKNFGIGVYNWIRYGLPQVWGSIKLWWRGVHKKLFGKKGMFSSAEESMNTIRKIALAWVIGNGKKILGKGLSVLGTVLKWAFKLCKFVPGWGTAISIVVQVLPPLITFITTQIMLLWSNHKADADLKFKDMQKEFSQDNIQAKLMSSSSKIIRFTPPQAIPNMDTPKPGKQNSPLTGGAIMRHVELQSNGRSKFTKEAQNRKLEEQTKENEKSDKARFSDKSGDTLVGNLRQIADIKDPYSKQAFNQRKQFYNRFLKPQIDLLDQYIVAMTRKAQIRFPKKSKRPLYDFNTGWNPEYRVLQSDLMSAIPLNPIEPMHRTADIPFGEPARKGSDSYIGIMPYTWMQNGIQVTAHPIMFEIERAKKIRDIYTDMWGVMNGTSFTWGGFWNELTGNQQGRLDNIFPKWAKWWRQSNLVSTGGYSKDVIYGDAFQDYLKKFRSGQIDRNNNSMDTVEEDRSSITWKKVGKIAKIAGWILAPGLMLGISAASEVKKIAERKAKNAKRALSYNKNLGTYKKLKPIPINKGVKKFLKGLWGNIRTSAKNIKTSIKNIGKRAMSAIRLGLWRRKKFHGIRYGEVRDAMFDDGILDLFQNRQILAPISKAESMIKVFIARGWLPRPISGLPLLGSFIKWFLDSQGIKGFDWNRIKNDNPAMAGFAQAFLEHIGIGIIPLWNSAEKLLTHVISNSGDGSPKLIKVLHKLHQMFNKDFMFETLAKYLRFRNLKTYVIDETNATWMERLLIRKYKKELGMLSNKEVDQLVKGKKITGDASSRLEQIEKEIKKLTEKIKIEKFEARFTGGDATQKVDKMMRRIEFLVSERNKLRSQQKENGGGTSSTPDSGTKIVQPSQKKVEVVQPPPKSPEQIAKEQEEQRKRDAEAKKKAEEEKKKKLEEEKKRREQVAIAKAKIAAMEAIKKQEQNYETILEKMVADPSKVTDAELKSLGKDVDNLKQEAENKINQLPREQRDLKLALIRGDKISPKTFKEMRDTAVGLGGSLQNYIDEVKKIPCGSIVAVNNQNGQSSQTVVQQDPDSVDMGN